MCTLVIYWSIPLIDISIGTWMTSLTIRRRHLIKRRSRWSAECWPADICVNQKLVNCQPRCWYLVCWLSVNQVVDKVLIKGIDQCLTAFGTHDPIKLWLWFNEHSRRFKSTTMTNLLQVAGPVNFWMWHVKAMLWKEFTDSLVMNVLKAMLWIYISDDSCDDFENKFGHNSGFSLNDVLWTCSNMFSKR